MPWELLLFLHKVDLQICFSDTVVDDYPNQLMETAEHALSLVDTGFFINTSYPPLLRPERKVDLILHLNYTGGSQTLVRSFNCSCLSSISSYAKIKMQQAHTVNWPSFKSYKSHAGFEQRYTTMFLQHNAFCFLN